MDLFKKLKKKNNKEIIGKFKYLTLLNDNSPMSFADNYNIEADVLHEYIDHNEKVYNIAVVARYGAGKSSLIDTYLHKYRRTKKERRDNINIGKPNDNKYKKITLSSFNGEEYSEVEIEKSILQQLLYSRRQNELPHSEVKRTNKIHFYKAFLFAVATCVFLASSIILGFELGGGYLFDEQGIVCWLKYVWMSIIFCFAVMGLAFMIYYRKLKKIKYKDFEVDINMDDKKNLLNKYIDEILYFFECVNINLVIFEDLDRLPTTKIFTKLRELNIIINENRERKNKVTFLYAVKDDLFKTEERAKFFEFILPVIPVINQVTASNKLRDQMDKCVEKNPNLNITEKFIKGVSAYIPDMRILKNTVNDYLIMFSKIFEDTDAKVGHLRKENLFGLCLYKNLYPYDYALTESNNGLIPMVVNIEELKKKAIEEKNKQIVEANDRLEKINSEKMTSLEELKKMFKGQICSYDASSKSLGGSYINVDSKNFSFKGLNFSQVEHPKDSRYVIKINSPDTEIRTPSGDRYEERESIIIEKQNNKGDETRKLIEHLQEQKQEILGYNCAQLVNIIGIDNFFSNDIEQKYISECKKKDEELVSDGQFVSQVKDQIRYLQFLLANDYIDENYIEYTSNYKAKLITKRDSQYVADVQVRKKDFDYIPDDIKCVICRLNDDDFSNVSVFNRVLLDNLSTIKELDNKEKTIKHEKIIELLSSHKEGVLETIGDYLMNADESNAMGFLKEIIPVRSTIWEDMKTYGKLSDEKLEFIIGCILSYTDDIEKYNDGKGLADYLSNKVNYLKIFNIVGEEKSLKVINSLHPCFKQLARDNLNGVIQQTIINNCQFELTLDNVEIVCMAKTNSLPPNTFYSQHISFIKNTMGESFLNYYHNSLNQYISSVILDEKITLSEESQGEIESLINNKEIDLISREALIKKCNILIKCILNCDANIYSILLKEKKIDATWENVIIAYSKIGYSHSCVEAYILSTPITGSFGWKGQNDGEMWALKLYEDIIKKCGGTYEDISRVLSMIDKKYKLSQFDVESMTAEELNNKVDYNFAVAIDLKQIVYDKNDLLKLIPIQFSFGHYLKNYHQSIVDDFNEFFKDVLPKEVRNPINNKNTYKAQPLTNVIIGDIVGNEMVEIELKQELITKSLDVIIIDGYEQDYANYYINNNLTVPKQLLWQFKNKGMLDRKEKQILLSLSAKTIDMTKERDQYISYFSALGEGFADVYNNKKIQVRYTKELEDLLKELKKYKLVNYSKYNKKDIGMVLSIKEK